MVSQHFRHVRGAALISAAQLTRRLLSQSPFRERWSFFDHRLRLGNVALPRRLEFEHILILGSQGSGKSSLVRSLLKQVQQRRQSAIVIDPECEFVQEFYDPNRGDWILNPLDGRGPFWSPWLEFREEQKAMDVQAMCSSLVRGRATGGPQLYWQTEARQLLEKALHQTTNLATLRGLVEGDKGPGREGAKNALWPLSLLPQREQCKREWSALQWASKREGWLFLTSTEDSRPAIQALQGIWLDLLIRRLMSSEIGGEQVWVVADEVATMGYQPKLEESLITRGRKRGLSVVLSLQNIAQLRSIYGHDPTITLASQPGTAVLFKCREPESALWASRLIGEHEVSDGKFTRTQPLVMASEIQTLPKFRAYAISGEHRSPLRVKKQFLKSHQPAFDSRPQIVVKLPTLETLSDKRKKQLWRDIWQRTNNQTHVSYQWYGAKGIELRFESAEVLFQHLGAPPPIPEEKWTVDRIDCSGHYEPGNVRWADKRTQTANRRLKAKGQTDDPTSDQGAA